VKIDARTQLIWRVRGTLGPEGMLELTAANTNPADDPNLRHRLVHAINGVGRNYERTGSSIWADDRGLLKHGTGQLCHEIPADVVPWTQVWELIAPGITDERVAELRAAWHDGKAYRALHGQHFDDRLHMACCAFFAPVPKDELVQLDIFDLIGATA
jgi:hypothetical protein